MKSTPKPQGEGTRSKIGYVNLEQHRMIHQEFLETFGQHAAEFRKSGELTSQPFSFLSSGLQSILEA